MAAVTAGGGGSLFGKLASVVAARKRVRPVRLAAVAVRVREHIVTVAALGAFDLGGFQVHVPHLGAGPGWLAVCVSLLALDFAVRG